MKIKELINRLEKLDPEMSVCVMEQVASGETFKSTFYEVELVIKRKDNYYDEENEIKNEEFVVIN